MQLSVELTKISALAFSDDTVVVAKDKIDGVLGTIVCAIRLELKRVEYKIWKTLLRRSIGVTWYEPCTLTNSWVSNKIGLTSSE